MHFIDNFSKFTQGYLCKNKEASTILYYTKEFFKNFGFPDELGTDNSREYINKKFNNYLSDKNIKFIQGRAYNPRSQDCVERLHRTIKINLINREIR